MENRGLTNAQVEESRLKYGSNKLPNPPIKNWKDFVKETLNSGITKILIAILVIQFGLALLGLSGYRESIVIAVLLGVITAINMVMNLGIQKSKLTLMEKTSTRFCNVIRNGQVVNINRNDIVVGDVLVLETGQEIYADGYVIEGKVAVSNAAINGESKECEKTPVPGYVPTDMLTTDDFTNQNCVFAGTTVMSGEAKMVVTRTGINTVNGDTLVKMQTLEAPKTSLDIALDNLANFITKWGTIAALVAFGIMTVSGVLKEGWSEYFGTEILQTIHVIATNVSIATTIIIAAVPEGLPLIIQLVTKQNVKTMERANILAKNPNKIPELANINLICTDKTGTLTTGIMTAKKLVLGSGTSIELKAIPKSIKANIILNNSAKYDSKNEIVGGNSIDRALLNLVDVEGYKEVSSKPIAKRQAFSSSNKYSAVTVGEISYYKGAPEKIIAGCTKYINSDGELCDLTEEVKGNLNDKIYEMTTMAMRCIALAQKSEELTEDVLPGEMILQGVIGVVDPVRKEVPHAVKVAKEAGIQVIEITGDCIETAIAVAKEAGIYNNGDVAITDREFCEMSDDKVKEILPRLRVIARCSPNTKLRLVTLAQELNYSVAMTGDGTNDSPALKRADIGFAMNAGTDVAKEAGDIILTDDNFASTVKAVKLGRTFMHNIMMFLDFQLPINISLLVMNLLYPIFWVGSILTSVQILIVNIIMDSLNSLSFGGEPPKEEYMKEKPIKKGSGLFVGDSKQRIAVSTITFIATFGALLLSPLRNYFTDVDEALAARFALLCIMATLNGFNIRTDKRNLFAGLKNNKLFVIIATGIIGGVFLITQFAGTALNTTALSVEQWGIVAALSLLIIPVDLIRKTFTRAKN